MLVEWVIAIAGLAATLIVGSLFVVGRGRSARSGQPTQVRRVRINGTYLPSEVHVSAGQSTRLIFRREETAPCSERVVFPDYGISVTLPPFQDVPVDLPASDPGEHAFTCQMEMLHGTLIVDRPYLNGHSRRRRWRDEPGIRRRVGQAGSRARFPPGGATGR